MAGGTTPGPLGAKPASPLDPGTSARIGAPPPGTVTPAAARAVPTAASPVTTPAPAPAPVTDPVIEALNLRGAARRGAYALKKAHPAVKFTSGRRGKEDQARAMASNVVSNRKWIAQTYRATPISAACQKWVDDNPGKKTQAEIAAGLAAVMAATSDAELAKLSKHLSGDAFDVQPVEKDAEAIKKTIRSLEGLDKFLDKEGGLVRWHAQFS